MFIILLSYTTSERFAITHYYLGILGTFRSDTWFQFSTEVNDLLTSNDENKKKAVKPSVTLDQPSADIIAIDTLLSSQHVARCSFIRNIVFLGKYYFCNLFFTSFIFFNIWMISFNFILALFFLFLISVISISYCDLETIDDASPVFVYNGNTQI